MKGIVRKIETFIDDRPLLEQIVENKLKHKLILLGTENIPYRQSARMHGAVKHELSDKYKNLNRIELEFMKYANSRHSFISSYFNHFGFDVKTIDDLEGMWKRREDIMEYEASKTDVKVSKKKPKANKGD